MFKLAFLFSIETLKKNRVRTLLTIFGVTIGIAMVVIVLSAGESVKNLILGQLEMFGDDWIEVEVKVPSTKQISRENAAALAGGVTITTLTQKDAAAISKLPNIKNYYSGITSQAVVSYRNEKFRPTIFAVTPGYFEIDKGRILYGRPYTSEEERGADQVVVLGWTIYENLFGNEDSIGKIIKIDQKPYRVIGVMEERGVMGFFNIDEVVYMPLKTAQKKIMGIDHILWVVAQMEDTSLAEFTAQEIKALMRQRHGITDSDKEDFAVITLEESMEIIDTVFTGITWLLVALAAISLLVGGVGIMNVMYVSVAERTFEIGLRKSIGASKKHILWQFLIEAVVITLIGGIIGIASGSIISFLIAFGARHYGYDWEFNISFLSIILGVFFSTSVGLIFGVYPAKKAASLDPIIAIRKE